MIRWAEVPKSSLRGGLTAASEAHAISRCLAEQGLDARAPLPHRNGPISVHQQLSMLNEASQLAGDPLIAVRVGLGLHPTSYGIAGLALLSSASLRQALQIVIKYGALLCLKVQVDLENSGGEARLVLENCFDLTPGFLELCVQLEVAKLCALLRDLSGCRVLRVVLASPVELCAQLEKLLGAPVLCGRGTNYVSFDSALLDEPLPQADATTLHNCLSSCDEFDFPLFAAVMRSAGECTQMILKANGAVPTLSQIAGSLVSVDPHVATQAGGCPDFLSRDSR